MAPQTRVKSELLKPFSREESPDSREPHTPLEAARTSAENFRGPFANWKDVEFSFFLKLTTRGRIYFYVLLGLQNNKFVGQQAPRVN